MSGLSAPDIIPPQSGQNFVSVFIECGGISYFRDSDDEPHVLQNRSSLSKEAIVIVLLPYYSVIFSLNNPHNTLQVYHLGINVSLREYP
jgi:hypothetical protein